MRTENGANGRAAEADDRHRGSARAGGADHVVRRAADSPGRRPDSPPRETAPPGAWSTRPTGTSMRRPYKVASCGSTGRTPVLCSPAGCPTRLARRAGVLTVPATYIQLSGSALYRGCCAPAGDGHDGRRSSPSDQPLRRRGRGRASPSWHRRHGRARPRDRLRPCGLAPLPRSGCGSRSRPPWPSPACRRWPAAWAAAQVLGLPAAAHRAARSVRRCERRPAASFRRLETRSSPSCSWRCPPAHTVRRARLRQAREELAAHRAPVPLVQEAPARPMAPPAR